MWLHQPFYQLRKNVNITQILSENKISERLSSSFYDASLNLIPNTIKWVSKKKNYKQNSLWNIATEIINVELYKSIMHFIKDSVFF